jgi:hypothetical protein
MEPQAGGHIEIEVCVMHHVQSPKHRNGVMQDVLGIHHKGQRHHTDEHLYLTRQGKLVEQPPTLLCREQGHTDGKNSKDQCHGQRV